MKHEGRGIRSEIQTRLRTWANKSILTKCNYMEKKGTATVASQILLQRQVGTVMEYHQNLSRNCVCLNVFGKHCC